MHSSEFVVNQPYSHRYDKGVWIYIKPRSESHGMFWSVKLQKAFPLSYGLMTRCV